MKNNMPKTIYAIRCNKTGRTYIGCCTNVNERIGQHFSELSYGRKTTTVKRGVRGNTVWQNDYNEHGRDSFQAYVIERNVPSSEADKIDYWRKTEDACYMERYEVEVL